MALRVAVVGARRVRQGLGPFVARDLAAAGASVEAVVGTSRASAGEAARELAERFGIRARPATELEPLLGTCPLDALVILSPSVSHEAWLERALEARLHVLCEKPLVWGGDGLARRAAALAAAFHGQGLLLAENCQWPRVLPSFRRLHPDLPEGALQEFSMHLSPVNAGEQMLGDSLPHPLSLLQALVPDPAPYLEALRLESPGGSPRDLDLAFDYVAAGRRISCQVRLRHHASIPRPAGFALDRRRAERRISMPDYHMQLCDGARCVPLPDPLTAHVQGFCAELGAVLGGAAPPDPAPLVCRMEMLEALVAAYRSRGGG